MSDNTNLSNSGKHQGGRQQASPELADLQAQLARQAAQIEALTVAVHQRQAQQPSADFVQQEVEARAREMQEQRKRIEKLEEFTKLQQLSNEERNQRIADQIFADGPHRFRVQVVADTSDAAVKAPDPGQPSVVIRAHSSEEAEGRYRKLCGIRSIAGACKFETQRVGAAA